MAYEVSPTARALLALEVIQDNPGITAQQLGERLGVSDRAARRYVAILREAELPVEAAGAARALRWGYRRRPDADREMEIEPWAVVLRHSRWYLLGWSRTRQARRVLRVDRIRAAEPQPGTFTPPPDLDALGTLEDHLSQGWPYSVEVLIDAKPQDVERWLPRSLGRLEPDEAGRTRLRASTEDPDWYVRRLAVLPASFRILGSDPVRYAMAELSRQLASSADRLGAQADRGGQLGLGGEREPEQQGRR